MRKLFFLVLFCTPVLATDHPGADEFVQRAVTEHDLPESEVRALLEQAEIELRKTEQDHQVIQSANTELKNKHAELKKQYAEDKKNYIIK